MAFHWDGSAPVRVCTGPSQPNLQCITSANYSFLVNDSVHGIVVPSRGIRQDNPLSPYIFILCGEVLSGLCKRAQRSGHLSGLRVATPALSLNHLLFADDTMFFLNTDANSCSALMDILDQYRVSSGQLINASKSPSPSQQRPRR